MSYHRSAVFGSSQWSRLQFRQRKIETGPLSLGIVSTYFMNPPHQGQIMRNRFLVHDGES